MFATGILAHSLLLPFISILVQVFVVNFWFGSPDESPSQRVEQGNIAIAKFVEVKQPDTTALSYNYSDYFAAEQSVLTEIAAPFVGIVFTYFCGNDFIRQKYLACSNSLRAPPSL